MTTRLDVSAVPLQGGYIAKQCPVRIQNDILRPVEPSPPSAEVLARMADGVAFEEAVLAELAALDRPDWVLIDPTLGREEAVEETVRALGAGAELIAGGWLPADQAGRRTGKPDLLLRHGDGYLPVDVKNHLTLDVEEQQTALVSPLEVPFLHRVEERAGWTRRRRKDDALQLAHYWRMLEATGYAASTPWGGIIGKERVVAWYDLEEPLWQTPAKSDGKKRKTRTSLEIYDFEFCFRLDIAATAQQLMAGRPTDLLVEPLWNSECPDCPWLPACRPVLERGSGDPSLLPRITYREWRLLRDHGISDRAGVARLSYGTAQALLAGADPDDPDLDRATAALGKASFLPEAILNARAALGEAPVYRLPGAKAVVPRADIEIDVDMENTNDGVYLWGALVSDRAGSGLVAEGYHPFVTWEPLDPAVEEGLFRFFWDWLSDLRRRAGKRGLTVRAYCWYASAENTQIRRLVATDPTWGEEVKAFLASGEWVDLEQVFKESWTTGGSRSLKVVAPLAGHTWPVDDPGGGLSMLRHRDATNPDLEPELQEAARHWLLDYNRGDVEATKRIREWLDTAGNTWPEVDTDESRVPGDRSEHLQPRG